MHVGRRLVRPVSRALQEHDLLRLAGIRGDGERARRGQHLVGIAVDERIGRGASMGTQPVP